jgi:hypothetical protein
MMGEGLQTERRTHPPAHTASVRDHPEVAPEAFSKRAYSAAASKIMDDNLDGF